MTFNKAMCIFGNAYWTDPFAFWNFVQRRGQAEYVASFVAAIAQNDLLFMVASLAEFTVESEYVVWDANVSPISTFVSFGLHRHTDEGSGRSSPCHDQKPASAVPFRQACLAS